MRAFAARLSHSSGIAILFATIIGLIGLIMLISSHAATPTAAIEPEQGIVSGTAVISDSSASSSSAVKFQTSSTGNCTPIENIPASFPNNCNTGYANAPDYPGSLHACSDTITSNTTYNFCSFGQLSVGNASTAVSNVTFHGCLFKANAVDNALVMVFGDNITFDYSTFQPNATFVANSRVAHNTSYQYGIAANGGYYSHVGKMTVSHSDFWGFGNAIDTRDSTQAKPQVFQDNWIHDAADDGNNDYHIDGIGDESDSGNDSYVVLNHNTIVSPGNTNGIAFQKGTYSHFTITNNYVSGWGYTIALWAPATYTTFTGNVWGTNLQQSYGPLYDTTFATSTGSVWKNNTIHYVNPIYQIGDNHYGPITAADDGKFWTPDGISSTDFNP